jgi:dihydrofolate reductase
VGPVCNGDGAVMRKLVYSMTVSLDGYIAGPDGAIDWTVPDEELFLFHTQQIQETGVHLCGRRLYEAMAYWETAEESPLVAQHVKFAQIWKALPKVVFSTTLESVVGNTMLARDGVGEEVSRLKEQPGKDIAVGGAGLARACMKLELIDEWWLFASFTFATGACQTSCSWSSAPALRGRTEEKRSFALVVALSH